MADEFINGNNVSDAGNDSVTAARLVLDISTRITFPITGSTGGTTDTADWYRIDMPKAGILTLSLGRETLPGENAFNEISLVLYSEEGTFLSDPVPDALLGSHQDIAYKVEANSSFLVKVDLGEDELNYTLTITYSTPHISPDSLPPSLFLASGSVLTGPFSPYLGPYSHLFDYELVDTISFGADLGYAVEVSKDHLYIDNFEGPFESYASVMLDQISDLYIAYFDRPADVAGLAYWFKELYTGSITLAGMAYSFSQQEEWFELYPIQWSNREFIEAIYTNLFDRSPDEAGWDYWEEQLNSGLSRNIFVQSVIDGAYAATGGEQDRALLINKHDVAMYYTELMALFPDEVFDPTTAYVLDDVTADRESVANAMALLDLAVDSPISVEYFF